MSTVLKTECPHCGKTLKVSVEQAGKRARCPKCQQAFEISAIGVGGATSIAPSQAATDTQATASDSSTPVPISADRRIGRFELKAELGRGGFGQVFRAYDPVLERDVALKLPRFTSADGAQHRRFVVEAKAAARLKHPHIVGVFECGDAEGQPYIVSEFVSGETLAHRLKRQKPSISQAVSWVRDLAEALAYAHREGVVHRDIKPENIMLGADDRLQIMDFGLAKRTNEESSLTMEGSVLGTPAYMSPEQAQGDLERVGPPSDQYSLGATLYQLLTGQPPFSGPPHKVVAAVASVEPATLRSLNDKIPLDLAAIVQKAMEKDYSRRYADIGLFATDLDRWLRGDPVRARPISQFERAVRWGRKNRTVASLLAAVVIVSLLGTTITSILWTKAAASSTSARKANADLEAQQADLIKANETAETAAEDALAAAAKEREATDNLRHRTYVAEINRAQHAVTEGDVMLARQVLEGLTPKAGEPDLRDFEWHYLWRCCHLSQPLGTRGPNPESVRAVAFSPDDTQLATTEGKKIHIWNVATKTKVRTLDLHQRLVMTVAWHPSGQWLCSGTSNQENVPGELFLWNTAGWSKIDLESNGRHNMQAVFSADGKSLFVATAASTPGNGTPGGKYLYFQSEPGEVLRYAEPEWKLASRYRHETRGVLSVAVSQDAKWLAAGGADGKISVWNTTEPEAAPKVLAGHTSQVWALQFASSRNYLFSAGGNNILGGHAYCWDVETGSLFGALNIDAKCAYALSYSGKRDLLALAGYDRNLRLWNLERLIRQNQNGAVDWVNSNTNPNGTGLGHREPIASVAISSDGSTIASGSWEGELLLWKTAHVLNSVDWPNSPAGLESVRQDRAYNYKYHLLQSAYQEKTPEIVLGPPDQPGQPPPRYLVQDVGTTIRYLAASYDQKYVAIGTWLSGLVVQDVKTKEVLYKEQLKSHGKPAFSPDNRLMAVAVDDGTIRIYSVGDWKLLRVLKGHTDVIWDVWFHPNSRRLASGSWDQTTRVWDVEHGDELLVLPDWSVGVMFDKEGKTLSASSIVWRTALPADEDAMEVQAQVQRDELSRPPAPKQGSPYDRVFARWFLAHNGTALTLRIGTENGPPIYAGSLKELPNETFVVEGISLGDEVRSLQGNAFSTLSALSHLRSINTSAPQIGDAAYAHIGKVSQLRSLAVSGGTLGNEGLKHLANLAQLEHLRITAGQFRKISLNGESLRLIAQIPNLSSLSVMSSEIRDADLAPLTNLPKLQELTLLNVRVTGEGLAALAQEGRLTSIGVTSADFNDQGAAVLAQMPLLRFLYLGQGKLTNAGFEQIAKLPQLESLQFINFGCNDEGMQRLAGISTLKHLTLIQVLLTDLSLEHLTRLENLETLTFSDVPLTAKCLPSISKLPRLRRLTLYGTAITRDEYNEFKAKIPNIVIEYQAKN